MAVTLFAFFVPISILYGICIAPWQISYFSRIVLRISVAIDQLANVICAGLFNHVLVKKGIKPFGLEDDTVSEVLARNRENLTSFGLMLAKILDRFDPGHLDKALIENEAYQNTQEK